jgi:hypothetical protein
MFFMARAAAPTLPGSFGATSTTAGRRWAGASGSIGP